MKAYSIRVATTADLPLIENLQRESHATAVNDAQKTTEGFVSLQTPLEMLQRIYQTVGIICAVGPNNELLGYEIPLPFQIARGAIFLRPFLDRVLALELAGEKLTPKNTIIEGQICIRQGFKGIGIAEALHENFINLIRQKYRFIVTEISTQNPRSLQAHTKKLGFRAIQEYSAEGKMWYILAQEVT